MTDHPFAAMADIVKRATRVHGAIAADLVPLPGYYAPGIAGEED